MREVCWKCFWPLEHCWCRQIQAQQTRTLFVFLMHPKEFKQEKAGTGRLTSLSLAQSCIEVGVGFDDHPAVNRLIEDPSLYPVLLYPSADARNVSNGELALESLGGRRLTVFLLDATWACAKKMLTLSLRLQQLPKLMFTPTEKSRFIIKRQPHEWCLSTLEATHQLLHALEASGLDHYPRPDDLPQLFEQMQEFQIACAQDESRAGYRKKAYKPPALRTTQAKGRKGTRSLFWRPLDQNPSDSF